MSLATPAPSAAPQLPADVVVLERGWLSSNSIVLLGDNDCILVDSGYVTHAQQTLALVEHARGERPLRRLLNTHLHSDHCGGNAALQAMHPDLEISVPARSWEAVVHWDEAALTYRATGQSCPQFRAHGVLSPGDEIRVGGRAWQVKAAPGHDPDSVILFDPRDGLLISADALWERGFGVVFPELEGEDAFAEVASTLDLIETLQPRLVIPGHGAPFSDVAASLRIARQRLEEFRNDPVRHATHAARVLLKFKLLELQQVGEVELLDWALATPYFQSIHARHFRAESQLSSWARTILQGLIAKGALAREAHMIVNR